MKRILLLPALLVLLTSNAKAEGWACSAPGIVEGSYDGGGMAYIHLQGFPDGKPYAVVKKGKTATGTTSNGTKFVCAQK
ncbi:MAG: hypothetical protein K2X57_12380 [Xanthobacteraceae bacterium]|nr:hypothetical protein [Xanthobacteraceae bacterium]